jgi:hypothetical protein
MYEVLKELSGGGSRNISRCSGNLLHRWVEFMYFRKMELGSDRDNSIGFHFKYTVT